MSIRRLLNTSAMRIALRYAGLYALLMALGLGILYWVSSDYVDEQISTGLKQRMNELMRIDRNKGRESLIHALNAQEGIDVKYRRHYLLLAPDNRKLAGDLKDWPSNFNRIGQVSNIWIDGRLVSDQDEEADGYWPMIAQSLSDGGRLLLAQSLEQAEELQEVILYTIMAILLVSIGLALTMGWFIGRTLLARVDNINATAKAITSGDFSHRVPVLGRHDEFDELAEHLNSMLIRIEQLLSGMRQVTDNIAHDLRKPLSRLRNRLEITLLEERNAREYQQVLTETVEDADDLIRTFNALLEIAQTEAGSFRGEWQSVDLSELLVGLGELYRELAESQGKSLMVQVQEGLSVTGNRHLLAQAISNLLDNAIKYTGAGGQIRMEAERIAAGVGVQISDNGPGIPTDQYALVWKRFSRLDAARSTSGSGLGLSLVKAVAELHGVGLRLEDNRPGLSVRLQFSKAASKA